MWGKNAGWMTLGENLGKKGLTAINLGQEKDGAILKRPDVDISSDLSGPRVLQTDRHAFSKPQKFLVFKIRYLSISEKILQKHRLITRKIIFIVPQGPKSVPLTPPVAPPMTKIYY